MRYIVTGAAGFIGSHVVESLLGLGHEVVGIDNFQSFYERKIKERNIQSFVNHPKFRLEEVDITNKRAMAHCFSSKITNVVHLAAMAGVRPSIEAPELYNEVNIRGTLNILELMKENQIKKMIFASSSSVYGNNEKVPFSETDNVDRAISPYAATKKAGEVICYSYHHLYDIDMILLRFFTVYGPRQRPDLAIHKFTRMISEGVKIPFYGDGITERDYTYIDDIVDGVTKSCQYLLDNRNVYEILNLGESQTISLNKMVATIERALEKQAILDKQPMQPGDVQRTFADISKAKKMIKYSPKTKFEEGVVKFVKWYKEQHK